MQRYEREGVGLVKTAHREIAKAAASYEQLRKVQQGYPGEEVPLIVPPSLDPHPTVSSTSAQANLDFLSFPPISDEQFLAEYREASKPNVVLIGEKDVPVLNPVVNSGPLGPPLGFFLSPW